MKDRFLDLIVTLRTRGLKPDRGRISVSSWWTIPLFPTLLIIAILIPYNVLYYVAYLWGWMLLVSWIWVRYQGPRFALLRDLQTDWAQVGDELTERWALHNSGILPILWLQVEDDSTLPGYSARRIAAVSPRGVDHWTTAAVCRRRGRYHLGPLTVELGDPLGLFRYRQIDTSMREMLVYPPLVRLPTMERPRGQRGGAARASILNILPTPSAGGIRDYRAGDPLNYIHWRAVARTGKLMVKEFDQEVAGAVWIVLDLAAAAHRGSEDLATEELGIVLACSLANLMLDEGRTVGLYARGAERHVVHPGRGRQHIWEFMSTLVDAHADGVLPLPEVLAEMHVVAPGLPSVVLITPDLSDRWAGALAELTGGSGSALAILLRTPEDKNVELARQLTQFGIRHSTFTTGEQLALISPPRANGPQYRISPLGRAVRLESPQ